MTQVQRSCPIVTCGAGKQCVNEEMRRMEKQVSAPVETKAKGMRQQWCPLLSREATAELSGAKQKVVRELTCCGQLRKQLRQITCVTGQEVGIRILEVGIREEQMYKPVCAGLA